MPAYPNQNRSGPVRFIRSILPTHFTRSVNAARGPRGNDGVFANVTAKPEPERGLAEQGGEGENGLIMAEFTQKEGPPVRQSPHLS